MALRALRGQVRAVERKHGVLGRRDRRRRPGLRGVAGLAGRREQVRVDGVRRERVRRLVAGHAGLRASLRRGVRVAGVRLARGGCGSTTMPITSSSIEERDVVRIGRVPALMK